jgi:hypothetical protein
MGQIIYLYCLINEIFQLVAIVSKQIFGSFKISVALLFKTVSLFSFNFKCTSSANSSTLADAFAFHPS